MRRVLFPLPLLLSSPHSPNPPFLFLKSTPEESDDVSYLPDYSGVFDRKESGNNHRFSPFSPLRDDGKDTFLTLISLLRR